MRYDLNLLPILNALVEERSVTRAAERLGMTQPALSNALSRLRRLMRDPLFVRERYGMQPTQKALELAPIIAEALARIDDVIVGQQAFEPALATQRFTIAANSYAEYVLLPVLAARMRDAAPGMSLRVVPFGADLAETGVTSGTTAMVLGRVVDPPDNLVVQELMRDGLACVVRSDMPGIAKRLTVEQYESLRHINLLPPGRLRAGLFQVLEQHGLRREVAISVTHFLAIPEVIVATGYCSTLPTLICRRLAGDDRLRIVAPPVDLGRFPVQMAWHVRYRDDPAHRWLRSLVTAVALDTRDSSIN